MLQYCGANRTHQFLIRTAAGMSPPSLLPLIPYVGFRKHIREKEMPESPLYRSSMSPGSTASTQKPLLDIVLKKNAPLSPAHLTSLVTSVMGKKANQHQHQQQQRVAREGV